MKEMVSVVIPVHNSEKYITKCLDSVLKQKYQNFEIIIILDNCTDNTEKIVNRYVLKNKNISKIISNCKSAGLSRNIGLENVKGKYICFLDSDDYIDENYILKLLETIKKENADVVFCGYNKFNDENIEEYSKCKYAIFEEKNIKNNFLKNCFRYKSNEDLGTTSVWAAIYKMDNINKNKILFLDENKILSEDTLFNLEYLMTAQKVVFLNDNLYYYNKGNNTSITQLLNTNRLKNIDAWYNKCIQIIKNNKCCIKNLNISYLLYLIDYIKQEAIKVESYKEFKDDINNIRTDTLEKVIKHYGNVKEFDKKKKLILILFENKKYFSIFVIYKIYYLIKGKKNEK